MPGYTPTSSFLSAPAAQPMLLGQVRDLIELKHQHTH